jgi:hypothetical protein
MNKIVKTLSDLGACPSALDWATEKQFSSRQAAWNACKNPNHLFWFLGRTNASREKIVLAACACARLALPYVAGPEALAAIEAAEAWANGKGSIESVRIAAGASAANAAAYATTAPVAAHAANAAALAGHAATCAACAAAAYSADSISYVSYTIRTTRAADSADSAARLDCCVEIRKIFPSPWK